METYKRFEQALRSWVGASAYMWGGNGESTDGQTVGSYTLSTWVQRHETADSSHTKDQNINRVMTRIKWLISGGVKSVLLGDCSGSVLDCLRKAGFTVSDMNAASMYNRCKKIDKSQLQPGDLLFRHNGKKISHVGVYIGGSDQVVENLGRDSGMTYTKLDRRLSGELYWNRFGVWPGMHDDSVSAPTVEYTEGDESQEGEIAEPVIGGGDTVIVKYNARGGVQTVNIRDSSGRGDKNKPTGAIIGTARSGAYYPYLGETVNGFHRIDFEDADTAYISADYTEVK